MKNTTSISIRVDEDVKRQAEDIFNKLGMNLSIAMNLFLHMAVRYGGIPFDLRLPVKPRNLEDMSDNEFNMMMDKAFSDAAVGKGRLLENYVSEMERKYSL